MYDETQFPFEPVTFSVPGKPRPWGIRKRADGQTFVPQDRRGHMGAIREAWEGLGVPAYDGEAALALGLAVYLKRPSTHFRANGELKPWAINLRPRGGEQGGDVTNFGKLVEDALQGVAFHDDTQIAEHLLPFGKWYCSPPVLPHTVITLALAELAERPPFVPGPQLRLAA